MENQTITNRQVVEEWQRIIDSKNFDELENVENEHAENISPGGIIKGIESHKRMLEAYAIAFPDYIHDNTNFIDQGEWIAMQGIFYGTHTGNLSMGNNILAPTNKRIEFPYCSFIKVLNQKVMENHFYYDSKTFLVQLGIE